MVEVQITCAKIGQFISTVGQSEVVFVLPHDSKVTKVTQMTLCMTLYKPTSSARMPNDNVLR